MADMQQRILDFSALLTQNSIPFSGVSDNNQGDPYPSGIAINYLPAATAEQIAWAENAKEIFDWRPRRLLTRQQIVQHWQGLTTAQQNGVLRHLLAMLIRANRGEVLAALADTGVPLPIEEVDPT